MSVAASPSPVRPLVRARGLSVRLSGVPVLEQVNLDVAPGELVVVTGEPGSGKTTLLRSVAGDVGASDGSVWVYDASPADGRPEDSVAMVWQDLAVCENLDVAANLMLGRETRRLVAAPSRLHAVAREILKELDIPIRDTTQVVSSLTGVQRQLLAIATAMGRRPRLLLLDEPTASLGLVESAQVEALITRLLARGTTIVLATRDIEQMFRLAGRIVVLRHGRIVAEVEPASSHPDDVAALLSGQPVDLSARRQLTRLHGLADRLVSADPSSNLATILSALGAALASERVCIHVREGDWLLCAASLGLSTDEIAAVRRLPMGASGGSVGRAVAEGERVIDADVWSVPVTGPDDVCAAITVFRDPPGPPQRDELDLLTLYAGLAASAVERDRLLAQVTARNQVLETIREMLETLAGPVPVDEGLAAALTSLMRGLAADDVGLLTWGRTEPPICRAQVGVADAVELSIAELHQRLVASGAAQPADGKACELRDGAGRPILAVPFQAPGGTALLFARWSERAVTREETALIEDAAHSLRLALEREEAVLAHQEAAALRRSRVYQRDFLSRLSHELRTPLTAIRGYASSLRAPDVRWDAESERRFLDTIAAESARLGRLVEDLLDFSAIESGVMRLTRDWCDLALVADAAASCLPPDEAGAVEVRCSDELPPLFADHDRLEQVLLNLLTNAVRHNPPGTRVALTAAPAPPDAVEILVYDDGLGLPADLADAPFEASRGHRSSSAGAGLGLSITRGIVEAHGGTIDLVATDSGTTFRIRLPIEPGDAEHATAHPHLTTGRHDTRAMTTETGRIRALLVEDDPSIVDLIRSNLAVRGFETIIATDGDKALAVLDAEKPDIVLLDLMLPETDGFVLCGQIRERSHVAVIVVSARGGEHDKVTALNMGADDYMTKPFGVEELLARISATLRRTRLADTGGNDPAPVTVGDLVIDLAGQEVTRAGETVHLTPTEFALLRELVTHRGKLLSHAQLLRRVWGVSYQTEIEYLRVYVGRLRAKLESDEHKPLIMTAPRAGYRFVA